ncbi:hypothetical protein BBJ28_00013363 [Nothophytophthora sp. Chile5]|nr:hypothetical protein BBJ28_00013363 [Nothophytophthora sp. Chile5]
MISAFLGPSPNLTLARACSFGSLALLDQIWTTSCTTPSSQWNLAHFLRSDTHYKHWAFSKALEEAARHGHLHVIKWLLAHFQCGEVDVEVVEAAAEAGHLQILQFLYDHSTAATSRQAEGNRQRQNPPGVALTTDLAVCWGHYDMEKAAKQGYSQIVRWVHERTAFADDTRCLSRIVKCALERGDLQLVQWLLAYGFPEVPLDAVLTGRADVVQWLLARGRLEEERVAACAMKNLARDGNLELMQRLVQLHMPDPHRSWLWRSSWLGALEAASQHGHLPEVQWLIQHSVGRALLDQLKSSFAMHKAAVNGHLEVAQYLHKHGFHGCSAITMFSAATNGHLRVVRWLLNHFVDVAFFHAQTLPMHSISQLDLVHCSVTAMEAAAINGHLEVLQFLHRLDVLMGANARKRARGEDERMEGRRPTATHRAMDGAAGNGHLDVVKWLHANRSEGCTTAAMDAAAANGHLHVVQWLHGNTSEGCTTTAMDSAAANGHLNVVQWLYNNRSEGCTDKALDSAVASGHLRVAQWLLNHHISSQVPSASAVREAGSTSFEMLLFLHTQCPASFSSRVVGSMLDSVPDHIRAWLVVHYSSHNV